MKFDFVCVEETSLHFVLEYCPEGSLSKLIEETAAANRRFTEDQVASYLGQMLLAVEHLHNMKLFHRDINPDNMFLSDNNTWLKFGDFGMSSAIEERQKSIAGDRKIFLAPLQNGNTAPYMPLEVLTGGKFSRAADMWSVGVTVYKLLQLRLPVRFF